MNRSKAPKIPPLIVGNKFILNCKEKATLFTNFFCRQCTINETSSKLPDRVTYKTDQRLEQFTLDINDIIPLINTLNANKATGPGRISSKMLLLCGDTVALPLKIIFNNILTNGVYSDIWKIANVTPVHKKGDKQ